MIEIADIQILHEKKTIINNHASVYSESSINSGVDLLNEDVKFNMEVGSTDHQSSKQRVDSYGLLSVNEKEYSVVFEDKTDFSIMEAMGPQL